jgi:hypothetical protein
MALESIKSKFSSVTDVLLLRGDAVAEKVLIAWIRYRPAFKDSAAAKGEDESSTLDRLWEGVGPINFKKLGAIAGLPETVAEKSFRHLQAALIVWPDGTTLIFADSCRRRRRRPRRQRRRSHQKRNGDGRDLPEVRAASDRPNELVRLAPQARRRLGARR